MKLIMENWNRFLSESSYSTPEGGENNAEKLRDSSEVLGFINSLNDEMGWGQIQHAIFEKFIDYPDVKDVDVLEAGYHFEGSLPFVVMHFEEGKGIPPWDESLYVSFNFEEPREDEDEDEESSEERERRLRADDLKAAKEILKTRAGGYSGTALPGGKRIK